MKRLKTALCIRNVVAIIVNASDINERDSSQCAREEEEWEKEDWEEWEKEV